MALFIPGITTCGLCDELVAEGADRVSTPHFIAYEAHPLWPYSDSVIHRRCFRGWPHRRAFVAEYLRAVYPPPVYRLRALFLRAIVWWWGRARSVRARGPDAEPGAAADPARGAGSDW